MAITNVSIFLVCIILVNIPVNVLQVRVEKYTVCELPRHARSLPGWLYLFGEENFPIIYMYVWIYIYSICLCSGFQTAVLPFPPFLLCSLFCPTRKVAFFPSNQNQV